MQYFSLQLSLISNIIDNKSIVGQFEIMVVWFLRFVCGMRFDRSHDHGWCGRWFDMEPWWLFGFWIRMMWGRRLDVKRCFNFEFVYERQFDWNYNHKWRQRRPAIDKNYGSNAIMRDWKTWDYPSDFRASQMIFGLWGWWFLLKKIKMV